MKMNIKGDEQNNAYFNEVLYGALKRTFGDLELTKIGKKMKKVKINPNTLKLLTEEELLTMRKIDKVKHNIIRDSNKQYRISSVFNNSEMRNSNYLNPLVTLFFARMTFKSWLNFQKHVAKGKKNYLNRLVTLFFVGMTFKCWLNFQKHVAKGNNNNFEQPSSDSEDDDDVGSYYSSSVYEDEFDEVDKKEYEEKAKKTKGLLEIEENNDNNDLRNEEKVKNPTMIKIMMKVF